MRPSICVTDAYRLSTGFTSMSNSEVELNIGKGTADMLESYSVKLVGMLELDSLVTRRLHYSAARS